jgi:hypothetical protein
MLLDTRVAESKHCGSAIKTVGPSASVRTLSSACIDYRLDCHGGTSISRALIVATVSDTALRHT